MLKLGNAYKIAENPRKTVEAGFLAFQPSAPNRGCGMVGLRSLGFRLKANNGVEGKNQRVWLPELVLRARKDASCFRIPFIKNRVLVARLGESL